MKIKIAIIGVGNCAASLVMGLNYYKDINTDNNYNITGLMHPNIGGFKISDIKPVCAFDVDKRKVYKDLSEAIFSDPNNTKKFSDVPLLGVKVLKGPILDGVAPHMKDYFQVDESQKELSKDEILNVLKESKAEIIINFSPVGSQKLTEFWAEMALDSKCGFINAIPVFIASNEEWANRFKKAGLPIIGDDCKSLVGSTIINRYIVQCLVDRGAKIDNSFQINLGGNTDFLNMTDNARLKSKRISKTESIASLIPKINDEPYVYAGPNGYIECLKDNKIANLRIDFRIFGNIPCSIDCKLSVEDSPNSAGIMVDAIRIMKLALEHKISGPLLGACGWLMKHPPVKFDDNIAKGMTDDWIKRLSINQK